MKNKSGKSITRLLHLVAMVAGVAMIITGIAFVRTSPSYYSTDSAISTSFGGDFYTYSYRATRIAADNAAATAHYVRDLMKAVYTVSGAALIFAGIIVLLKSLIRFNSLEEAKSEPEKAMAAVPETATAPAMEPVAAPEVQAEAPRAEEAPAVEEPAAPVAEEAASEEVR